MEKKSSLGEFRNGGVADERITKTIRIRPTLEARVKKGVLERRLSGESRRFCESDLIEEALAFYFEKARKK